MNSDLLTVLCNNRDVFLLSKCDLVFIIQTTSNPLGLQQSPSVFKLSVIVLSFHIGGVYVIFVFLKGFILLMAE